MNVSKSCPRIYTEDEGLRSNRERYDLESFWRYCDIGKGKERMEANGNPGQHRISTSQQNQAQQLRILSFLYASTVRDNSISECAYDNR